MPLFATGKGSDATGEYYEDAAGVKHYYLFQTAYSGTRWSINNTAYSRANAQSGTADCGKWVNGSIFAMEKDSSYGISSFSCSPSPTIYGFEFETHNGTSASHPIAFDGGSAKYTIGEYGIHSVSGNTLQFKRSTEGEEIHLAASQTWSGPSVTSLSSSPFVIVPNYAYQAGYKGYVTAEDDVVLTIEGDTVVPWLVYDHDLANMDMVIRSPAIVSLPVGTFGSGKLHVRKVTFDGGCGIKFGKDTSFIPATGSESNVSGGAKTYGIGSEPLISPVKVAQTIVLTNGATLTALETTIVSGGVTVVSAGTTANAVSGTFKLPDNTTVFRIEEGSALDLTGATFTGDGSYSLVGGGKVRIDAAQAPFARFVDFTGTVEAPASRLVVTDDDVAGEVTVANGETLTVVGNGLGANASLVMDGGSTLLFCRTATISAPVTSIGSVNLQTSLNSVTGTVAGVWTGAAGAAAELKIDSPGLFVLSGGGTLGNSSTGYDTLRMNSGNAAITGVVALYGYLRTYGGHLTIRDGGKVTISRNYRQIRMDVATKDACIEVGTGGVLETLTSTSENSVYIGKSSATTVETKILVTGGDVKFNNRHYVALQCGGVIEVDSGTFRTQRRIACVANTTKDNAKVIIRNGTYHAVCTDNYQPHLFYGSGGCMVSIDGNATLKLEGPANVPDAEGSQVTWTCAEGARLSMGGWRSDRDCTFTMHNFEADGLAFDLNGSASSANRAVDVVIADPAQNPLNVGFVLPGKSGCKVAASGATPNLVASYIVPDGQVLDMTAMPDAWYDGFGEMSVSNVVFEENATLRFSFFGNASPLAISGTLTLPSAMNYSVAALGEKREARSVPVVAPMLGVAGGECMFSCVGGIRAKQASLAVAEDALVFSYEPKGLAFTIR